MAKLDFALWDSVSSTPKAGQVMADVYDEHIRLAQRIEELGWHSYFVIEHQNSPVGRITVADRLPHRGRARDEQLRIGAMMWQLPFYHPLRLAQEVAMLDQLSRGRVEFGTGIGVHEHEFIRWGMDYYQRAAISEEVLEDRQDGLDPGRGHVRRQVLPVRRGPAAAQALPAAVPADLGRRALRRRRSSSRRATTSTSRRTSTRTRWWRASSTSIARSGRSATTRARCRASSCSASASSPRRTRRRTRRPASTCAAGGRAAPRRRRADRRDAHRLGQQPPRHGHRQRAPGRQGPRRDDAAGRAELRVQHRQRPRHRRQPGRR